MAGVGQPSDAKDYPLMTLYKLDHDHAAQPQHYMSASQGVL